MNRQQDDVAHLPEKERQPEAGSVGDEPGARGGAAAGQIGAGLLQRKLQRRALARKGAERDGAYGGVYRSVGRNDVVLASDASKPKDTLVAKLKKDEIVQPLDLGAAAAVNKDLGGTDKSWWKVKVVKGDHAGKEGWVVSGDLASVYDVKDQGKKDYTGKVGDGQVDVSTGQGVDALGNPVGDNMFSLHYEGKDAADARWLQFIWREVIGLDDKGAATPVKGDITTSGGTYQLTEGGSADGNGTPTKKNYNTDSADKSTPFYEAGFAGDRTADSATMYDQPYGATDKAQDAFKNGAKKVITRAHFSTFLIKGKKVAFKTGIHIGWTFAKKEDTTKPQKGAHTVSDSGAAAALPATIAERFHEQYPAYKDIK